MLRLLFGSAQCTKSVCQVVLYSFLCGVTCVGGFCLGGVGLLLEI